MSLPVKVNLSVNGRRISGHDRDRPEYVPIRAWRLIMQDAVMVGGKLWHTKFRPLHFGEGAKVRYQTAIAKRKTPPRRARGPEDSTGKAYNVFSGGLRRLTANAVFRAFQTRVTIRMPAPPYVKKRPAANQPSIHEEVTVTLPSEEAEMRSVTAARLRENLIRYRNTKQLPGGVE